jgi:hypothetical protein
MEALEQLHDTRSRSIHGIVASIARQTARARGDAVVPVDLLTAKPVCRRQHADRGEVSVAGPAELLAHRPLVHVRTAHKRVTLRDGRGGRASEAGAVLARVTYSLCGRARPGGSVGAAVTAASTAVAEAIAGCGASTGCMRLTLSKVMYVLPVAASSSESSFNVF